MVFFSTGETRGLLSTFSVSNVSVPCEFKREIRTEMINYLSKTMTSIYHLGSLRILQQMTVTIMSELTLCPVPWSGVFDY